ncbi:bifunctional 4-hydroxy-2-oxoglutarate aldolase/2-dehydro-3-deoxy-phosphogluconate aldolase [Pseudomonadota bacterium]
MSNSNHFSWKKFEELPVIGILRGYTATQIEHIVRSSIKGGLCNIEVTMNSPHATDLIKLAAEVANGKMNIGAGTVCTLNDLDAALSAGATFIVTPIVNADVIQQCKQEQVPVIPGGFTPTEIYNAWQLGADMVKVFPANQFGPGYIKEIKGPLDQIKLVPTGGITIENLPEYHRNGAYGFGVATPLFDKQRVAAEEWDWVQQQAKRFVEAYQAHGR